MRVRRLRIGGILALGALAVAAAFPAALAAKPSYIVEVPPGIRIAAKLDERLSSAVSKPGQIFVFETTAATRAGDVEIPAGTLGHGIVADAEPAVGTRPGKLALALVSIDLPDGRDVAVDFASGSRLAGVGEHVKAAVIPVPLPGGLIFLGGGKKPTNFSYPKGAIFTAQTAPASEARPAYPPPAASP